MRIPTHRHDPLNANPAVDREIEQSGSLLFGQAHNLHNNFRHTRIMRNLCNFGAFLEVSIVSHVVDNKKLLTTNTNMQTKSTQNFLCDKFFSNAAFL